MTTEEMIEVLQAYKEGKKIEMFVATAERWVVIEYPLWNFKDCKYRVKKNPTRLDVANKFFEKAFGIKNEFDEGSCIGHGDITCAMCEAHKEGRCETEKWWNEEYEDGADNDVCSIIENEKVKLIDEVTQRIIDEIQLRQYGREFCKEHHIEPSICTIIATIAIKEIAEQMKGAENGKN